MKLFAAFLAVFFTVSQLDLPFAVSKAPAKRCCCGSSVCRCAPGQGKACPLKKSGAVSVRKAAESSSTEGKSCHFSKSVKTSVPAKKTLTQTPPGKTRIFFTSARCGTSGEKVSLPSHAKDFARPGEGAFFNPVFYSFGFIRNLSHSPLSWQAAIDHPPRVF